MARDRAEPSSVPRPTRTVINYGNFTLDEPDGNGLSCDYFLPVRWKRGSGRKAGPCDPGRVFSL